MSALANVETFMPFSPVEQFFQELYGKKMKIYPKRTKGKEQPFDNERQWIFIGSKTKMKSMATQATLFSVLADPSVDTTFYTPNGYYRRDQRLIESLRWLNAYVFDFDRYEDSIDDIFDSISRAGLPQPTAIIQTPSGGYHVAYFFSDPIRATPKTIRLYTAIMDHMADDMGSDRAAVGANRIFRTPSEENLLFFEPNNQYSFDVFKEWREINHPYSKHQMSIHTGNLMLHPALQKLLMMPCSIGKRDQTAFTLALAMKASNWTLEQAEDQIEQWYESYCEKGGNDPFTKRDAIQKVKYVYKRNSLKAPKAEIIRELTGIPFYYQNRENWSAAKPREKRLRTHLDEWASDLLALLKIEGELSGTQQELATRLNCPIASFKVILRQLRESEQIIVETKKGRGGKTVICLPEKTQKEDLKENHTKSNVIFFPKPKSEILQNKKVLIPEQSKLLLGSRDPPT